MSKKDFWKRNHEIMQNEKDGLHFLVGNFVVSVDLETWTRIKTELVQALIDKIG